MDLLNLATVEDAFAVDLLGLLVFPVSYSILSCSSRSTSGTSDKAASYSRGSPRDLAPPSTPLSSAPTFSPRLRSRQTDRWNVKIQPRRASEATKKARETLTFENSTDPLSAAMKGYTAFSTAFSSAS